MKTYRQLLTVAALMAAMSVNAQGVRIYLKGFGNPIDYPASQIEKIEFYPAENGGGTESGENGEGDVPLNANEDKKFLEETGIQFINQAKADDFSTLVKSVSRISDYDTSALGEWSENCLNSVKTALGGSYTKQGSYGSIYQYTDYKYMLMASSFTGHFVVQNNKWVKESDANDLQFTFTDPSGNTCVAHFTTSGTTKTIHIINDDDSNGWNGNYKLYDHNMYYLDVPSQVEATYSINGTVRIYVTADIDVSSLGEEWDLSSQGASTSVNVIITKDNNEKYEIVVNRAGYQAGTGAFVKFKMSNNGKLILSGEATAAGTVDINSSNVYDNPNIDTNNLGAADANIDILGRVQLKSTINNVGKFIKYLEDADENNDNKTEHRRLIGRANDELKAEFFYNNGSTCRGTLSLDSYERDSWGSYQYYEMRPIITFVSDNSSYAIDSYFNEETFHTVVDTYKNLLDDFNDLIESNSK